MPKRNGPGIELLADPTRRRLIAALAISPRRPSSLAAELHLSRPATTRQLRILIDAGLVEASRSRIDGRGRVYRINARNHGRITAWLAGVEFRPRHPLAIPSHDPKPDQAAARSRSAWPEPSET
jgi:DNA-binding transcriptional ArsR family regulator